MDAPRRDAAVTEHRAGVPLQGLSTETERAEESLQRGPEFPSGGLGMEVLWDQRAVLGARH